MNGMERHRPAEVELQAAMTSKGIFACAGLPFRVSLLVLSPTVGADSASLACRMSLFYSGIIGIIIIIYDHY